MDLSALSGNTAAFGSVHSNCPAPHAQLSQPLLGSFCQGSILFFFLTLTHIVMLEFNIMGLFQVIGQVPPNALKVST